jgi:PQQ-dependent dehydrogenase (methanol/ethanol family)
MTTMWKVTTSALAISVASGLAGTASANDDLRRLTADPANVAMPSITYNGWNYSTLNQINATNVKNLGVQWTFQIGILDQHEASPLVIGDTMYIASPKPNYVYALDLTKQGVIKWEFRPTMDVALATSQTCCGAQTRGLYYAEGKIFYSTLDGQNIGLDAKSGEQLWRTVGTDITRYEGMAGNNIVIGKLFIGGNEGGEGGARGKVQAYNIDTGRQQWVMYNMGPANEVGMGPKNRSFYADDKPATAALDSWWGDSWKRGGGTSWGYFTWDPEINVFYYSTGNCGPWNPDYRREWGKFDLDQNGGLGAWKSNYCASQIARDGTTGELVWAYNMTPQDHWDLDEPLITPLIELNGRKVAIKAARNGLFYVWDRNTGELVNDPFMHTYQDIFKKDAQGKWVNRTTGRPNYDITKAHWTDVADKKKYAAAGGDQVPNTFAGYTGTEVIYYPGTNARNWDNDAYSPKTGMLYFTNSLNGGAQRMIKGDYIPGQGYTLRQSINPPGGIPNKLVDGTNTPNENQLVAIDVAGNKLAWVRNFRYSNQVPVMATATDLLFSCGNDNGTFRAMDAKTGNDVWTFKWGSRCRQSPITYRYNNKQYVAVIASSAAANTAVAANAAPDDANRYRRSGSTLYVFALPG